MIIAADIGIRGLTEQFPEFGTGPIATAPYHSEAHFAREKECIFRRTWLKVGRIEQVPETGAFFVRDIAVADTSILIVRGEDDRIRGFHNLCSHRGNKLVWDERGKVKGFYCGMHGWTYRPDGTLKNVPDEHMFYDLDKSKCGLIPVNLDVHQGFIYVNLEAEPSESLAQYLGEAGQRLEGFPFHKATNRYTYRAELYCNWKVAVDAFTEAYHVVFIHGKWGRGTFTSADNPLCQLPYVGIFGRHASAGIYGNSDYQPRATEAVAQKWGPMFTKRDELAKSWLPPAINPSDSPQFAFEVIHFFPNFLVHLVEGTYFTHEFLPLAVDKTLWEGNTYYTPPRNAGESFSQEYAHLMMRENWMEDTTAMEAVQSMLKSGARDQFILHDHEILPRHTYKVVMDYVSANEGRVR